MLSKETYKMKATCLNCGTTFLVDIAQGYKTTDYLIKCPYCGCSSSDYDGKNFSCKKPGNIL